jgi:hypothetical protein
MEEFAFSKSQMKEINKLLLLFLGCCIFTCIGVGLLLRFDISEAFAYTGILYFFIAVFLAVKLPRDNKRRLAFRTTIDVNEIIKYSDRKKVLRWTDITKIKIVEDVKGGIWSIKLWNKNKNTILLYGFNEMESILNLIKEHISNIVLVRRVRHRLDWQNPFVVIPICWGISTATLLILVLLGKHFWAPFSEVANEYVIHPLIRFLF